MVDSIGDATPLKIDMLILQKSISQGNLENIAEFSEDILNSSRSTGERDNHVEVIVRMNRALLDIIDAN